MITNEFAEASAELNTIFRYMPNEYVDKIPNKLRAFFNRVQSKDYLPQIDPNKKLEEQNIKEKTKDIIAILYRNYWCNEEERKEIDKILIGNDKRYEEQLREQYNPDDIFKKHKNEEQDFQDIQTPTQNVLMIQYKESVFRRIINKIKSFFQFK